MNYYKFEDLDIGMSFEFKEIITEEKMALFLMPIFLQRKFSPHPNIMVLMVLYTAQNL